MAPDGDRRVLRFPDGGWAEAIGGHPALDLVNTVAWRRDAARTVDRLVDGPALVRWARWAGVLDDDQAAAFTRELAEDGRSGDRVTEQVREGRERLHRVVQPIATGAEPAPADVDVLRTWLLEALGRSRLATVMPLEWATGLGSLRDLPDALALHAWHLLDQEDPRRLRQCQDRECGWLFLDRTRNASRIWCSSADCGNRTRARRHYERRARRPQGRDRAAPR